jgi:hypothetical protein
MRNGFLQPIDRSFWMEHVVLELLYEMCYSNKEFRRWIVEETYEGVSPTRNDTITVRWMMMVPENAGIYTCVS